MTKVQFVLIVVLSLVMVYSLGSLSIAANPEDYQFVRYLFTFDTIGQTPVSRVAEVGTFYPSHRIQEVFWNNKAEFVKQGQGSLGFVTNGTLHTVVRGQIFFLDNELPFDFSGGRYLGFWVYFEDISTLDNFDTFPFRVYLRNMDGEDAEFYIPGTMIKPREWNFIIIDLQALTDPYTESEAPLDQVYYLQGAGQLRGFAQQPMSLSNLMRLMFRMYPMDESNVKGYIDGIALYN